MTSGLWKTPIDATMWRELPSTTTTTTTLQGGLNSRNNNNLNSIQKGVLQGVEKDCSIVNDLTLPTYGAIIFGHQVHYSNAR